MDRNLKLAAAIALLTSLTACETAIQRGLQLEAVTTGALLNGQEQVNVQRSTSRDIIHSNRLGWYQKCTVEADKELATGFEAYREAFRVCDDFAKANLIPEIFFVTIVKELKAARLELKDLDAEERKLLGLPPPD